MLMDKYLICSFSIFSCVSGVSNVYLNVLLAVSTLHVVQVDLLIPDVKLIQ